jgi:cobalamin-dependent methionine synthase I
LAHYRKYHSRVQLRNLMKSGISSIKSLYNSTHDGFRIAKGVRKDGRITVGEIYAFSVAAAICFELLTRNKQESKHNIAIGVMAPAVQDCGKNLIRMVWQASGHQVIDFGIKLEPKKCLELILENRISVLGLSIMVNAALARLRELLELIAENRIDVAICLGGMSVNCLITHKLSLEFNLPLYYGQEKTQMGLLLTHVQSVF